MDNIKKKMQDILMILVLLLSVPLLITLFFAFFLSLPNFVAQVIVGGGEEGLLPIMTVSIFWKVYGVFLSLWSIVLLYFLSFQD